MFVLECVYFIDERSLGGSVLLNQTTLEIFESLGLSRLCNSVLPWWHRYVVLIKVDAALQHAT